MLDTINRLLIATCILLSISFSSCTSDKKLVDKFYKELDAGNLTEARNILSEIEDYERWSCAEMLIEEYIKIDDVDKAIFVYERITPTHYSNYHINWHTHSGYEINAMNMIYKALIEADEFEKAWKYHKLEYEDEEYAGNASCYFNYMVDVLHYLTKNGRGIEAQTFLNDNVLWFKKYVDNGEWGEKYPNYSHDNVKVQLQNIINEQF